MFDQWLAALEARHLADLRVPELTRALRALSSAYVERRHTMMRGAALDSAGKRAAFALFYGPLHFLAADRVVRTLGADAPPPSSILDVGCGTGAAGAAWALAAGGSPITGLDRHRWAVNEARWTYCQLGLRGRAHLATIARLPPTRVGGGIMAAYVLNELPDPMRTRLEDQLIEAAGRGIRVLVLEPVARAVAPWWDSMAARVRTVGGRSDEWRFAVDLPPLLRRLDRAAGLDHREMTVRSMYVGPT